MKSKYATMMQLNSLGQVSAFARDLLSTSLCRVVLCMQWVSTKDESNTKMAWKSGEMGCWDHGNFWLRTGTHSCLIMYVGTTLCSYSVMLLITAFVKFTGSWETIHMFPVVGTEIIGRPSYSYFLLFSANRSGYASSPRDWIIVGYTNPILLCQWLV